MNDKRITHIYMSSPDGIQCLQLTFSNSNETLPRWSPDNKYLAFLSGRGIEGGVTQLWLLNRVGGEAKKITNFPGGVNDYSWSPDGKRLALVVSDLDSTQMVDKTGNPPNPILIDRFYFKEDVSGYLRNIRQHIYILELATRKIQILTPGRYDEYMPSWSPDASTIAFVSKRGDDFDRHDNFDLFVIEAKPNAIPRQHTTYDGADSHPNWGTRPEWSPDGSSIAYLQGGPKELFFYAIPHIAICSVSGGSPQILAKELDRPCRNMHWALNGQSLFFLLEDNSNVQLANVAMKDGKVTLITAGRREIRGFDCGRNGTISFISSAANEPDELCIVQRKQLQQISHFNDSLMARLSVRLIEPIKFKSKDSTLVYGFLVKPTDYSPGKLYPTILWIHGGPVWEFFNEFSAREHRFAFMWQLFAANGYVVIAANPRGSSGRGEAFSRAIFADWGNKDVLDVLAAVDYAVSEGSADPQRLGIGGWSYGGILTNYVIAQDTRFKAAISGAGISNILAGYGTDMYVREYELEFGPPWSNLEGWLRVSFPFLHADRIVTPTLFLCGEKDFNVPLLNSEQMYQALKSIGIRTQLVIYPGQFHGFTRTSYQRDRFERYINWYNSLLKY